MKAATALWLAIAFCGWAAETQDRAAIERLIGALNDALAGDPARSGQAMASLFTPDADNDLPELMADRPWSEMTAPHIAIHSVRFVTADVALIDGASTQFGSAIMVRRMPLFLLVKKQPEGWRIVSLRLRAQSRVPR